MSYNLDIPKLISRNFALSLSVEPLANKEDCTTRFRDSSPNTKLEYFIISGINTVWPIYEMAFETLQTRKQVNSIFKYARDAQQISTLSRGGGRVTFGQTMLFIPYLASQLNSIIDGNKLNDVNAVPNYVSSTINSTSVKDVENLEEFCWLAINQSKKSNKSHDINRKQPNPKFKGIYSNFKEACTEKHLCELFIVKEILDSYSTVMEYVNRWSNWNNKNLLRFSEEIYPELKNKYNRFDVAADLISLIIYILLCKDENFEYFN